MKYILITRNSEIDTELHYFKKVDYNECALNCRQAQINYQTSSPLSRQTRCHAFQASFIVQIARRTFLANIYKLIT
jgi:hypothetical protein